MLGISRSHLLLSAAALALTAGWLLACGGGSEPGSHAGEEVQRYDFIRVRDGVIRIDSQTGAVSSARESGDGGWTPLGSAPAADQPPGQPGRYQIFTLATRGRPQRGPDIEGLVLFDSELGRTWLGRNEPKTEWLAIAELSGEMLTTEEVPTRPGQTQATATDASPEQVEYPVLTAKQLAKSPEENEKNIDVLIQVLEKEGLPTNMKVWAVRQLAEFDKELAVPPLIEALDDGDPEVVVAAIEALGKTRVPSTIPKILTRAQHPDPRVRAAVQAVVVEVR